MPPEPRPRSVGPLGLSDPELVECARAGDSRALAALLDRHHDRLYALCHRLTGGVEAEDACQESLIAIVRGLSSFDGRSSFSTWAYRVATNACFDELRRRRRRPIPDPDVGEGAEPATTPDTVEGAGARLDVANALAGLSAEFRAAVVLRDLCDLPYAEIAGILGVPVGTVRSRIARGRAALLSLLQGPERPVGAGGTGPERPVGAGGTGPERPDGAGGTGPERPVGAGGTGPERPVGAGGTGPERPVGAGGTGNQAPTTERPTP